MQKEYEFNGEKYLLEKDDNKIFDYEEVKELLTTHFKDYDYVFADLAYNKLRLKGFCDIGNKLAKKTNDIKTLEDYLKNYCAYNCKWFLLKKLK